MYFLYDLQIREIAQTLLNLIHPALYIQLLSFIIFSVITCMLLTGSEYSCWLSCKFMSCNQPQSNFVQIILNEFL